MNSFTNTKIEYVRTKVEVAPAKPKAHPVRMKLPEHLRREVIVLMPDQDVTNLRKIGEEVTEVLEYVPADLYVKQFIRFKYAAPAGQGASTVLSASLPGRLLEKCMAGEGLLAQMIVDKYLDHLPIHRQLQRFERMGVRIPQSTSNDWVKNTLSSLHSIYQAHKRITLATSYLSADETPIKVLDETMDGAGVCCTASEKKCDSPSHDLFFKPMGKVVCIHSRWPVKHRQQSH